MSAWFRSRGWPAVYLLSFLLYLAVIAIVMTAARLPVREVLLFSIANTLPPALFGILVVRYYRTPGAIGVRRGGPIRHFVFGLTFAVASVATTLLLTRLAFGPRRFGIRPDAALWAVLIAGLLFVILASAAHLYRVQSDLARERERAVAAEGSRARAELAALRAKIDPHFLFNTLHSLLALVRQDPSRAEEAIEQFGDTLRYTFGAADGNEERTLQQEFQLIENYLALERLRLGDRLRVHEKLDPDVAQVPLPVLTLQPLVENAIRHAIAPRAAGGQIEIHARRCGENVRIDVSDDGPGATAEALAGSSGRGLHLVRERLDRLYGGRAKMELQPSRDGPGLCVTIHLPVNA